LTTIYTIGTRRKPLSTFIGQLQEAGIDAVIDVRLRNTSHLAGYTKRDDLAFLLQTGFNIAYEHRPELAPTPEIRDAYRKNQDWTVYESRFRPLLLERSMAETGRELLARYSAPCLLCAETTAERCHRRLIAEHWAKSIAGLKVVHL
jgi:uncharacterized protein (DUF488 family)